MRAGRGEATAKAIKPGCKSFTSVWPAFAAISRPMLRYMLQQMLQQGRSMTAALHLRLSELR